MGIKIGKKFNTAKRIETGKWKIGWITPTNIIYVENYYNGHEQMIIDILGESEWDRLISSYRVLMSTVYIREGWVRLVKERGILSVAVLDENYEYTKHLIRDFIPFYGYIKELYLEKVSHTGRISVGRYEPFMEY